LLADIITAVLRRFYLHMFINNYTFSTAGMNKLKKKNFVHQVGDQTSLYYDAR